MGTRSRPTVPGLTEGPHRKGAEAKYDVVADPSGIVGRLARLASLFDQQSQKLRAGA